MMSSPEKYRGEEEVITERCIAWIKGNRMYSWPQVGEVLQGLGYASITFDNRANALKNEGIEQLRQCSHILLGHPGDLKTQSGDREFLNQLREKGIKASIIVVPQAYNLGEAQREFKGQDVSFIRSEEFDEESIQSILEGLKEQL